jgi:hypothetical protein
MERSSKSPLQTLNDHYAGKTIVGGKLHEVYIGWKIIRVEFDSYEPMLEFIVEKDNKTAIVTVLAEWVVEVE